MVVLEFPDDATVGRSEAGSGKVTSSGGVLSDSCKNTGGDSTVLSASVTGRSAYSHVGSCWISVDFNGKSW